MEETVIYSNDNYKVVLAERLNSPTPIPCYHLINVNYGVVEMEHSLLVEILTAADFYNEKLIDIGRQKEMENQIKKRGKAQSETIAAS